MGRWSRLLAPAYIAFAGVKNGDRVLDVGTGTGSLAATLEATMPESEIVGVDPSEGFIAYAQKNAKSPANILKSGMPRRSNSMMHRSTYVSVTSHEFVPDHRKASLKCVA